ncbi:MAG: DNA mismatch repair protein MutS, partial [Clostridiaceae bacterium]|nr:DNA mismatch repair protein MutS [Clostridiaceae bacterium]
NIKPYNVEQYMILDQTARRNLELTETIRDRKRKGSLLWAIDRTSTAMGARLLRIWVEQPLIDIEDIKFRQNAIAELKENFIDRQELIRLLKNIYDLERLSGRLALGQVNARDLIALISVLEKIEPLKNSLSSFSDPYLKKLFEELTLLPNLLELLKESIVDDPPITITEGGIIKQGFNPQVDEYQNATKYGKDWILNLEQQERDKTGIKSLKVGYNRVFGYYIDVRKSNLDNVPDHYIRRQTLTNSERYITDELKEMEEKILGAEQKLINLEYELFLKIREETMSYVAELKNNAQIIAQIDVLSSLAELADLENYCQPEVNHEFDIKINSGRHPVVEQMLEAGEFVPNDVYLNNSDKKVMILTGPNMAGKSTYMRQTALIVLLAQIGSFVPADSAVIGITDRIFTRVGAADDLAAGQSTFMVEMTEVAQIMRNSTSRSLLILDEIGRGTGTYDGLSIAWSVIEHIVDEQYINARTLFATHYHELTDIVATTQGVFNCHITATNQDGKIKFLYHIEEGAAGQSYGIEVAELAGVPDSVVNRSRNILYQLEKDNKGRRLTIKNVARPLDGQLDLFSAAQTFNQSNKVIERLKNIDMDYISPVDARNILEELIAEAKGKK